MKWYCLATRRKCFKVRKVDHMIIGGGMTFTFVKALGGEIGNSICEDDKQALALKILPKKKNLA